MSVSPSGPVVEGIFVNLTCSSHANPAVSYTWYRVNGRSPVQSGTQLILEKVSPANSGRYYCEAQNKHGALNSSLLLLDVLCKLTLLAMWGCQFVVLNCVCFLYRDAGC